MKSDQSLSQIWNPRLYLPIGLHISWLRETKFTNEIMSCLCPIAISCGSKQKADAPTPGRIIHEPVIENRLPSKAEITTTTLALICPSRFYSRFCSSQVFWSRPDSQISPLAGLRYRSASNTKLFIPLIRFYSLPVHITFAISLPPSLPDPVGRRHWSLSFTTSSVESQNH